MTEHLTDKQRERLLTPCECGHTINDHGSLVACWRCEDEDGDCSTPFETLLAARIEALLTEARAEGAREALREAADAWDLEHAEAAARSRKADVRCVACGLRWEERQEYGCHEPGRGHYYDEDDLREAAEVVIEPTWDGNWLRDRAARIGDQP